MAIYYTKWWRPGDTITVHFLGGNAYVRTMVEHYARLWLEHANLQLDFVQNSDAYIRISFKTGGSWSYVGTNCRKVNKNDSTMNFGWFTDQTRAEEFSETVLHDFGHVLGCVHEHQNPAAEKVVKWNKPAVYTYYKNEVGWPKDKVDRNVIDFYARDKTQHSSFDPKSIMLYEIPVGLTIDGYSTSPNQVLSETDKAFIAGTYP